MSVCSHLHQLSPCCSCKYYDRHRHRMKVLPPKVGPEWWFKSKQSHWRVKFVPSFVQPFRYFLTESRGKNGRGRWLDAGWSVASYLCKRKEKYVSLGHFCYLNWSSLHMLSLHRPARLSSPLIPHIFPSSVLSCPALLLLSSPNDPGGQRCLQTVTQRGQLCIAWSTKSSTAVSLHF